MLVALHYKKCQFHITLSVFTFLLQIQFKKEYNSVIEESFRMKIYMENKHKIMKHNQLYEKNEVSYKLGMNEFGDMVNLLRIFIILL